MLNIFKEDARTPRCGEVEERGNHLEAFIELVLTMSQTIEVLEEGGVTTSRLANHVRERAHAAKAPTFDQIRQLYPTCLKRARAKVMAEYLEILS